MNNLQFKPNIVQNTEAESSTGMFFVHGWGGSIGSLSPLAEKLSTKYKTFLIDLPGFGKSPMPEQSWGVNEYGAVVQRWMEQMIEIHKLKSVVYMGHSFGGGIGVYLASKYPSLINLLILADSAVYRSPKIHPIIAILKRVPGYELIKNSPRDLKRLVAKVLGFKTDSYKFEALEPNFRKVITQDLSQYAKTIIQPTLILWGNEDEETPVAFAYRLAEDIEDEILKIYPGIGHGLPKTNPELVVDDILEFISRHQS